MNSCRWFMNSCRWQSLRIERRDAYQLTNALHHLPGLAKRFAFDGQWLGREQLLVWLARRSERSEGAIPPHVDESGAAAKTPTARHSHTHGPDNYRFISTSRPGRRSLLISTSGSRTRRRSSIVTSGSRTPFPTVTSGVRVQFSPQRGPTQFRSHTSAALAERMAELVNAAATTKT